MNSPSLSRRRFNLRLLSAVTVFLPVILVSGGCRGKVSRENKDTNTDRNADPCDDLDEIPEKDIALRRKLAYVNESPIDESQCNNCNLYLPPTVDSVCGGCMLFKGPVDPKGYCTYWAPRV